MNHKIVNNIEFSKSVCEKIKPLLKPLSQLFGISTFGYRKFFSDGRSFGLSNNLAWTTFCQENFNDRIISNYENEVSSALTGEKFLSFRIGEPDKSNAFLSALYELNIWNTLSFYKNSGPNVEAFYFASTRDNTSAVEYCVNNIKLLERFSFYFKDKLNDIMSWKDIKRAATPTLSPLIFEKKQPISSDENENIQKFLSSTPIQRFFFNIEGQDIGLSPQEFKTLAWLSRGKSAKEVGKLLNISQRTVESYLENIKSKAEVNSRSRLIDLFVSNFCKDKDLLKYLEN